MTKLEVETEERRYDPGSEYLNHFTAVIYGPNGTGYGKGSIESEAVCKAVESYYRTRKTDGR